MLTESRVASLIKVLHDWHESIIREKHGKACKYYYQLSVEINASGDPYLIDCFKNLAFRYYLFINQIDCAQHVYHEMVVRKPNQTPELNYIYNVVRALYHINIRDSYSVGLEYLQCANATLKDCRGLSKLEKADFYYHYGRTSARMYNIKASTQIIRKALHLYKKEHCTVRLADCHIILGINYGRVNQFQVSEFHYRQALLYANRTTEPEMRIHTVYHNLGYNASKQGDHRKAINYYKKSLQIMDKNEFQARAQTMRNITEELLMQGRTVEAKNWCLAGKEYTERHLLLPFIYHFEILNLELDDGYDIILLKFLENEALPFFEMKEEWATVIGVIEKMLTCCQTLDYHQKYNDYKAYLMRLNEKYNL